MSQTDVIPRHRHRAIATYMSGQTRDEITDVLARPAIRSRYPHLNDARAQCILERLDASCLVVAVTTRYVEYPRDPDDEPVLNLAIHVGADYLVTRDRDLPDLAHNRDFRLIYPFLRIVDPETFLATAERDAPML